MIIEVVSLRAIPVEGDAGYAEFMSDVTNIIGPTVKRSKGKIYSAEHSNIYVGWRNVRKIYPSKYVSTFFECQHSLSREWGLFERKYKVVPVFKGAVHYVSLEVTSTENYMGEVTQVLMKIVGLFSSISAGLLITEPLTRGLRLEDKMPEKLTDIHFREGKSPLGIYLIKS